VGYDSARKTNRERSGCQGNDCPKRQPENVNLVRDRYAGQRKDESSCTTDTKDKRSFFARNAAPTHPRQDTGDKEGRATSQSQMGPLGPPSRPLFTCLQDARRS